MCAETRLEKMLANPNNVNCGTMSGEIVIFFFEKLLIIEDRYLRMTEKKRSLSIIAPCNEMHKFGFIYE